MKKKSNVRAAQKTVNGLRQECKPNTKEDRDNGRNVIINPDDVKTR